MKFLKRLKRTLFSKFNASSFSTCATFSKQEIPSTFKIVKEQSIPELGLDAIKLQHYSGATLLHLYRNQSTFKSADEESKVFSVAFATPPLDSRGTPHILEHMVLCGSRQYPVRDPFFKMLNRSLASYMNAWTGPDWTMYPFLTRSPADYNNLKQVYLDAVFRPLLRVEDFDQEAWRRIRHNNKDDAIQGVVYNEMKGALSDREGLFVTRLHQHLLEGTPYGWVSGGDPAHIPFLTLSELGQFHQLYYRPANCFIFSFGDIDLIEHLYRVEEYLKNKNDDGNSRANTNVDTDTDTDANANANANANVNVRHHKTNLDAFHRWQLPKQVSINGPLDPLGDPQQQTIAILSFLTNDRCDQDTTFAWNILSTLLLDGPSAPLYQALLMGEGINQTLPLGREYAPGTGYDDGMRTTTFSVGLQGMNSADIPHMERRIMDVLTKVRNNGWGLASERVEALLHQIELSLCYDHAKVGLTWAQRATTSWCHGICPIDQLSIKSRIKSFRQAYKDGKLNELLDQFIFHNNHRLLFAMNPDEQYQNQLIEAERKLVRSLPITNTPEQTKDSDDKSKLPCLALSDVPTSIRPCPFTIEQVEINSSSHKQFDIYSRHSPRAQGLAFAKILLPIDQNTLNEEELKLLPVLALGLAELAPVGKSRPEWDQMVKATSGGLFFSIHTDPKGELALMGSSYGLRRNAESMMELLREAFLRIDWEDVDGLGTIVRAAATTALNSMADNGHSLAALWSAGSSSLQGRNEELLSGLSQIKSLNTLVKDEEEERWRDLGERLKRLIHCGFSHPGRMALIADDEQVLSQLRFHGRNLVQQIISSNRVEGLSTDSRTTLRTNPIKTINKALMVPFASNYVAATLLNTPTIHQDPHVAAALALLARLLVPLYLHPEIREKGGAYGANAQYSSLTGRLTFTSYRDPHPAATIKVFNQIGTMMKERYATITEQDLLEAKLSLFSTLDAPRSLTEEGMSRFMYSLSDETRQRWREVIRGMDKCGIMEVVERYLSRPEYFSRAALIQEGMKDSIQALGFEVIPSLNAYQ